MIEDIGDRKDIIDIPQYATGTYRVPCTITVEITEDDEIMEDRITEEVTKRITEMIHAEGYSVEVEDRAAWDEE